MTSVCAIVEAFPGENPETLAELPEAVHENVAPATSDVSKIEVTVPVQILVFSGLVVRCGVGLIITLYRESLAHPAVMAWREYKI